MKLRYPGKSLMRTIVGQAREYAELSHDYTHNYGGWGDGQKKLERIMWGRIGQGWVRAVCALNGIAFNDDPSDYTEHDAYDLVIGAARIDVKTWKASGVPYQVNAELRRHPVEWYCFLKSTTNDVLDPHIITQGCVSFAAFWASSSHIACGQPIPGTPYTQLYAKGSNILSKLAVIVSFERAIQQIAGIPIEEPLSMFDSILPPAQQQAVDTLRTIAGQKPIDWEARKARARAFLQDKPNSGQPWASKRYEYDPDE